MNVHRAISGASVERVAHDKVHLVNIDATTDYLVKKWSLLVSEAADSKQPNFSGAEAGFVEFVRDLRLVHKPWNKVFVSLLQMFYNEWLKHVREGSVAYVV